MKDLLNTDYLRHNIHFPDAKYFENLAIVELSFVKFIMHHHHYHHNDRMEWKWLGWFSREMSNGIRYFRISIFVCLLKSQINFKKL